MTNLALNPRNFNTVVNKGVYVLADALDGQPSVLLLATGSKVYSCIIALQALNNPVKVLHNF